jgi:predicted  nucleic acid-binding Zn-ribbon protein
MSTTADQEIAHKAQEELARLEHELRTVETTRKALKDELKRWKQLLKLATNERRTRRGRLQATERVSGKTEPSSGRERPRAVDS